MNRREFLKCGAAGVAAALSPSLVQARQARASFRNLKVTAVDVVPLKTGSIFVLVRTNEGITGLGECSPMNARVITAMLRDSLVPIVVGRNPLDIDRIWEELYHRTYKLGVMGAQPEAISGIDIALWDILGRVAGLPLWQLMGGKRKDRIRMYSSIGSGATATVKAQVDKAVASVASGYTALKMRMDWSSRSVDVNPAKDWEIVSTVRKEVGDKIDLCYDANNGLSVSTAIRLGRKFQDELNVIHYEEPIAQHDYAGYAEICAALDMAVAAGEHEYTRWQFRDLIQHAKVDILQPDLVKCCGLSEGIRIAHLAQTYGKILVPHQTQPTIGNTVNLHFLACFDNSSRAQEYNYSPDNSKQLWSLFKQDYSPKNGYSVVPEGPGLGLELDEAAMKVQSM
ncbi:MAG TPA: mandelate racemase/muconate lactonizing enzyme family protein [Blastocatellia bacterium]|nr:mandelate racemase/muconate lactonizing enzyme family protein [Blastocatellia bacterium]